MFPFLFVLYHCVVSALADGYFSFNRKYPLESNRTAIGLCALAADKSKVNNLASCWLYIVPMLYLVNLIINSYNSWLYI
jgi:hypothetical protein